MSTLQVELPEELESFIREQARTEGFASTGEYLVDLIKRERLRRLLQEAADAPLGPAADQAYFEEFKRDIRARARAHV